MGAFGDYMAQIRNPGESGVPDTIYDDLEVAYADDLATATERGDAGDARIAELDSSLQAAQGEISRLKAINEELLMSAPGDDGGGVDNETDDETPDDDEITTDDLFEKDED